MPDLRVRKPTFGSSRKFVQRTGPAGKNFTVFSSSCQFLCDEEDPVYEGSGGELAGLGGVV
ncbi:MAG: hypothetical protein ABIU05_17640, partial [Nitrospirales bacterium]